MATFILIDPYLAAAQYTQIPEPYTGENFGRLIFGATAEDLASFATPWRKTMLLKLARPPKMDEPTFQLFDAVYSGKGLLARWDDERWRPIKLSIGDVRDAVRFK